MDGDHPESFLVAQLPVVDSVVLAIARRRKVCGEDLAEFRSLAYLKLVDRDYEALRRFRGTSSFRTYLGVVLQRVLLDYRNRHWGRWRPTMAARRQGALAIRIERLVARDGLSIKEALATLGSGDEVPLCAEFVRGLRPRVRPPASGEPPAEPVDPSPTPEALATWPDRRLQAEKIQQLVASALAHLDSSDHLLLTLRFRDNLSIADIAPILGVEVKPLYRRLTQVLARLRRLLSADHAQGDAARDLARVAWADLVPDGQCAAWWPSNLAGAHDSVSGGGPGGGARLPRRRAAGRVHRPAPVDARRHH